MNSKQLFCCALGLSSPWYIKEIRFEEASATTLKALHIDLDFARGSKFINSEERECSVHDTTERAWQHLNFFEHVCFLHARVPRIKDPETGQVETVVVPWAREGSSFTLLFEAFALSLIESEMPVRKVAQLLRVEAHRVWRVFNHYVTKAVSQDRLDEVQDIGIDETSSRKGHRYVTVVADLEERRTIHVVEGKDAATVADFKQALQIKGGDAEQIKWLSMDMSPAFISGAVTHFPQAQIVFDKFHLLQLVNIAIDKTRQQERKGNDFLKGHKYTVLRNFHSLSDSKKQELQQLLTMFPKLGEAYRLREMLNEVWDIKDPQEAEAFLAAWCDYASQAGVQAYKKVVNTFKAHWSGIVAYFHHRITNASLESINGKIQAAKRRARGYRNINNFINMIYFLTAKLNLEHPQKTS